MIRSTDLRTIAGAQLGMAARADMGGRVADMELPTLFLCGDQDVITPPDEMRSISQQVVGARYIEIEGAGHLAPLENPTAVNQAVYDFLSGGTCAS